MNVRRVSDPYANTGGLLDTNIEAETGRIGSLQGQLERLDIRLALRARLLRQQFTHLESAMSGLQSQGKWLSGQLAWLADSA